MHHERPHAGRRRNEATHQAILDAALRLLGESEGAAVTIDAIARAAGVGKQTVYRWWPSKGALLLDALTERSALYVPTPDSGSLRTDLLAIVESTFRGAQSDSTAPALRTLVREAAQDPHLAELLRTFAARRREAVRGVLERGQRRGELAADADLELMVDQFYGVFWYRFILGHAPLDDAVAARLTGSILS
ncbi:TetR/AcrR family transcriptional regulator [Nocardia seriolae]|uniref:HTH-type transcriptional regulator YdeS n=1 Tax=Nocardia seriolae TaxID=37332 RepID=A0A0B8NDA0_9NOCA|nr:TetR/AcrR family transcriptional regulator [Nocardia seriolae]APA95044.1 putative HTH-type transcriptional regulator YdeS [Nocardia seriolae]MTJ60324.1 TetR family transcriptional regulator [Nocardia seriolae]MTJ75009.1 TetR family transcriptional regulator [Nocardia seriolae]MTJ85311.1 TetR family transcriptional regulator [Nocardia seriolae]MTK29307.1 TetR family transcriptional regulator [Nocardia seriolae]